MKLRQLFEAPRKVAVAAFGRMNPPTIGHEKLVNKIKSYEGDHYVFLSQTQKPKTDPLPFDVKLEFAKKFFPDINVGHTTVRTPIQMLQMLEKLGYTDIIYVAGSDRVDGFKKLFNDYNGKEYNFNSIEVVSAGERDPDADGAEGMSASKMREAAKQGNFEAFAQGTPKPQLAQKMYDAVRTGMGIKAVEPVEDTRIDRRSLSGQTKSFRGTANKLPTDDTVDTKDITAKSKQVDMPSGSYEIDFDNLDRKKLKKVVAKLIPTIGHEKNEMVLRARFGLEPFEREYTFREIADMLGVTPEVIRQREAKALRQLRHPSRSRDLRAFMDSSMKEASYEGNLGLIELFKFFSKAEKEDPKLVARVKKMIKQRRDKEVWRIVQDYTGTQLTGKEFEGSIKETIFKEANYGKYWCSTDKKWKYRKGPKQSRSS